MEVVASLSPGRTAAAQCGLFTHKSVPVIFEPPCTYSALDSFRQFCYEQAMKNLSNSFIGYLFSLRMEQYIPKHNEVFVMVFCNIIVLRIYCVHPLVRIVVTEL